MGSHSHILFTNTESLKTQDGLAFRTLTSFNIFSVLKGLLPSFLK